jgi:uncharacterized protein (DUF697 family)
MHQVIMRMGEVFGFYLDPSQRNLLAIVASLIIYGFFINRSKG